MVTVSSESPSPPTLFPLIPSGSLPESGDVTIGCLAKDFLPDSITFSWNDKKNASLEANKFRKYPSVFSTNGKFTASTQANIPVSDCIEKMPFYCKADHSGVVTVAQVACCPVEVETEMFVRAPPLPAFQTAYLNSTITCTAIHLNSAKTTLQWFKDGEELDSGFTTSKPCFDDHNGNSITSELVVTKKDWLADKKFSCKVENGKYNNTLFIHKSAYGQGPVSCDDVRVETIPPTYEEIHLNQKATLTCRIYNIPYDVDLAALEVTFTQKPSNKVIPTIIGKPKEQENDKQTIDATATVCTTDWNSGDVFACKVTFPGLLPIPIEKTLQKPKGGSISPPAVYILPPPSEELALRESATLTCMVKNFYPSAFFVRWLRGDQPVTSEHYFTSTPRKESNNPERYTAYSTLSINEHDWNSGNVFSCVVGHEGLPLGTTQKTIDKTIDTNQATPSLFPLFSCCDFHEHKESITFACLLSPALITYPEIQWDPPGQEKKVFPPVTSNSRSFRTSQLTVPFSVFSQTSYKCFLKLSDSDTPEQSGPSAAISYKDCNPKESKLIQGQILSPNCHEDTTSTSLQLVCLLQSLGPGKVTVEWLENGEVAREKVEVTLSDNRDNSKGYIGFVYWNVSKENWDKGDQYSCKVTPQQKSQNVTIYTTSKCKACYDSRQQPTVSITKPSHRHFSEKAAQVTCTAIGFNLKNTKITWQVDGKPSPEVQNNMVKTIATGNPNVTSTHPVSLAQWTKGTVFTCKVSGPCYEEVTKEVEIKKETKAPVKPSITIAQNFFNTSHESIMASILVCNVIEFFPMEIRVSWKKDDVALSEKLYYNGIVTRVMDNLYNTYSILKIGRDEAGRKDGRYSCVVNHSSSDTEITASENVPIDFLKPAIPQVMAFHTSEGKGNHTLICFATNFYPKYIDIRWSFKGQNPNCSMDSSTVVSLADGKFQKNCTVFLGAEEWSKQEIYTCTVNHSSTNILIKKNVHVSDKSYYAGMVPTLNSMAVINMQLPSFEELFMNKSTTLSCMVPLANITPNSTFRWEMDGKPANMNAVTTKVLKETNGTVWIYSQLWVNLTEWRTITEISCSIPSGLGETKEYSYRRNGSIQAPKVSIQHYSSGEDQNVTLLCVAKDFYPGEIFLKWEEDNKEVSLKGYDIKDLKCDHEQQRCSLISILEVPTTQWAMGVSYTCLVAHISSENIITRRANSLSDSSDCTVLDVAWCNVYNGEEYSELEETDSVWNKVSTFIILFVAAVLYAGLVTFIKVK